MKLSFTDSELTSACMFLLYFPLQFFTFHFQTLKMRLLCACSRVYLGDFVVIVLYNKRQRPGPRTLTLRFLSHTSRKIEVTWNTKQFLVFRRLQTLKRLKASKSSVGLCKCMSKSSICNYILSLTNLSVNKVVLFIQL